MLILEHRPSPQKDYELKAHLDAYSSTAIPWSFCDYEEDLGELSDIFN